MKSTFVAASLVVLTGCSPAPTAYQTCMLNAKQIDASLKTCVGGKLKAQGYTDGMDCINNYEKAPCNNPDRKRYNAEAQAGDDCLAELHVDASSPNELNCIQYVNK